MCKYIYVYIKWRYVNVKIYCSSTPNYTKFSIWTLNCASMNVHFKSTFNQQQILRSIFVNIWDRENPFTKESSFSTSASLQLENFVQQLQLAYCESAQIKELTLSWSDQYVWELSKCRNFKFILNHHPFPVYQQKENALGYKNIKECYWKQKAILVEETTKIVKLSHVVKL